MFKKYAWVFIISMVPLIELRGAIPVSQGLGLPILSSYVVAVVGNMVPVPFIYLFARKVLEWGADKPLIGKFFSWCLEKGKKGGQKLQEKAGITASIMARLAKDENVQVDTISKICDALNCQPADIMENIPKS